MADPFLGEIKIMGFGFAPRGWALCNGQLLPISQNQALYALLGTTFGGNGTSNFALPSLQGSVPIHVGGGYVLGQTGGEVEHVLTVDELPPHQHLEQATTAPALTAQPGPNVLLAAASIPLYASAHSNLTTMSGAAVGDTGGSQGHFNMQPYLALCFCIALQGLFPTRQ